MIRLFGDNVKLEITTGIEDLKAVLTFITKNEKDTCIGYRVLERPYHSEWDEEAKKSPNIPTIEVIKYEVGKTEFNKFLAPLLPTQMYDQIYAWLEANQHNKSGEDDVFSDVMTHLGFTLRAGWFNIDMMNKKFQIWPTNILYGK